MEPLEEPYRPPEGRWNILIGAWKNGEPKWGLIKKFINWYPVYTYPLGERRYYQSVDQYGAEAWGAPHNIWRECCHIQAGFLITLPLLFNPKFCMMMNALLFTLMVLKESYMDAEESGLHLKNLFDALCWLLGSLGATFLAFLTLFLRS